MRRRGPPLDGFGPNRTKLVRCGAHDSGDAFSPCRAAARAICGWPHLTRSHLLTHPPFPVLVWYTLSHMLLSRTCRPVVCASSDVRQSVCPLVGRSLVRPTRHGLGPVCAPGRPARERL